MGFCLFLIDSEVANVNKLDQKRKLRLEKMDKIFHDLEVKQAKRPFSTIMTYYLNCIL